MEFLSETSPETWFHGSLCEDSGGGNIGNKSGFGNLGNFLILELDADSRSPLVVSNWLVMILLATAHLRLLSKSRSKRDVLNTSTS